MCFYFLCFIFGIHNTLVLICLVWLFVLLVHVDSMYFPFACGNRYIPPLIPHLCTRYMYINFLVSKAAHLQSIIECFLLLIYLTDAHILCSTMSYKDHWQLYQLYMCLHYYIQMLDDLYQNKYSLSVICDGLVLFSGFCHW
jgi:hypothetical protein